MNHSDITMNERVENDKWMAAWEAMHSFDITSEEPHGDMKAALDELIAQGLAASLERVESLLLLSSVLLASVSHSLAHAGASREETVFAFAEVVANAGVSDDDAVAIVHLKNSLERQVAACVPDNEAASGAPTE